MFFSCVEHKKEKEIIEKKPKSVQTSIERIDSPTVPKNKILKDKSIVERYFPEKNEVVKFDTIISAQNLKISIHSSTLDSYVINEFESEGKKYIDKYRDSEKHLLIEYSNEILIDTVFKKNDFIALTDKDFLKIADFHGYWFNGIENDTIELFGVISKPETDWSIAFYHYFDMKTKTFKVEEYVEEEY